MLELAEEYQIKHGYGQEEGRRFVESLPDSMHFNRNDSLE